MGRECWWSTIRNKYEQKCKKTEYTPAFFNLGHELQPLQSLRKSIERNDDNEFQDENKWTDTIG